MAKSMKSFKKMCPKNKCEICDESDLATLHYHHIVERTELHSDNNPYNICVACSNCHNKIHDGSIKIIGVFPSTKPPAGRTLVYSINGVPNIPGLDKAYYTPKPKASKI